MSNVLLVLVVSAVFMLLIIDAMMASAMNAEEQIGKHFASFMKAKIGKKGAESQFSGLSHEGKDPEIVIALAMVVIEEASAYKRTMALTSAYYSQVKFLIKNWRLFTALAFLKKAIHHAKEAKDFYASASDVEKSPIDLEVIGAPAFMLTQIPFFGIFYKRDAISFLVAAEKELKGKGGRPVQFALVYSKLWRLTADQKYEDLLKSSGIKPTDDPNTLSRVVTHMGLGKVENLFHFCGI